MPNNEKKYASLSTLQTFLDNLRNTFSNLGHKHQLNDITDYTVDSELSSSSTNPVQNKVLNAEFDEIAVSMRALDLALDGKSDSGHDHNSIYYTQSQLDQMLANKSDSTHRHDSLYDAIGSAAESLTSAKSYADSAASSAANAVKNDLLNGAGAAYDTLKELGDLITENTDAIDALKLVATGKADKEHTHAISEVNDLQATIDTMNEELRNNTWYGTCSTAANTAEKVVTTAKGNFELKTGSIIYVLFTYASCANATLNVDGTGAITIKAVGNNNVAAYYWSLNEVVGFVYDGTYFRMLEGMIASTAYYGMTKLSSSTNSSSTTYAATPSAVKAAYDLADEANTNAVAAQDDLDIFKADTNWTQIYDSGEITEAINAFANINIQGYKKLMVAVKCVNDGTNSPSKHGGVTFTSTNGVNYQFNLWSTLFTNAAYISGAMATFEISDGWLICPNATRILKSSNFLGTEGGVADNLNNTGSGIMKCTNTLSTMMISNTDNDSNYYFLAGSRVMVWGCKA